MRYLNFLFFILIFSCNGNDEKVISKEKAFSADSSSVKTQPLKNLKEAAFDKILKNIKIKNVPIVDSTNFDNFKTKNFLSPDEIETLQLEKIYPEFYKTGYNYKTAISYRIGFYDQFYTLVLAIYKGEHELESTLINYSLQGDLIDFKVIAYDEIAEGWSRIESKIDKNKIERTSILYTDDVKKTVERFKIEPDGKIK